MSNNKFVSDGMTETSPVCHTCANWAPGTTSCKAFPKGIPLDILTGKNDHTKPVEGDNGIQYSKA